MRNPKAGTINSFYASVFKRMKGVAHITNTTMVLPRVSLSSVVVVITYFLFCPKVFPFLKFLELPFNYIQKSYYNSSLDQFFQNALLAVFLPC